MSGEEGRTLGTGRRKVPQNSGKGFQRWYTLPSRAAAGGVRLAGGGRKTNWLIYIRTESPIKWCVGGHALICGLRRKVVWRLQSVVARGGKFILRRPDGEMSFSLSIQLFFVTLHLLPLQAGMRHLYSVMEKSEINHGSSF